MNAFRLNDTLAIRVRSTANGRQRALRLALLLDISESMDGERLASVKRTLEAARSLWQPEDRVTLVTFGEAATTVLTDHLMDNNGVEAFYTAVGGLRVNGCTNLSAGLEAIATTTAGRSYDALVILTDGMVNRGITGTAGLQAMALGLGLPATTLGYGADHNRQLLRDMALRSRGSYTFCDTDETLPVVIGQLLAELRTQVVRRAEIELSAGWTCAELAGGGIGSIVPDRDYWSVWRSSDVDAPEPTVIFRADGLNSVAAVQVAKAEESALVKEQSLRARVAAALKVVADALESNQPANPVPIRALEGEIAAEPAEFRSRGLVLRLSGELAEILAELEQQRPVTPPPGPFAGLRRMRPGPARLMARLSSQTAYLSTQRGVSSQAPDQDMFSSPAIRQVSRATWEHYSQHPPSPTHDPVPASPPLAPFARTRAHAVSPLPLRDNE